MNIMARTERGLNVMYSIVSVIFCWETVICVALEIARIVKICSVAATVFMVSVVTPEEKKDVIACIRCGVDP
jgi:hypothetical protein